MSRRLRRLPRLAAAAGILAGAGAALILAGSGSAHAEGVILSISQPQVRITSSFAGADLVLFGVAEAAGATDVTPDVVVTVRGPQEDFVTWRKSRMLGLWINSDSRTFVEVPAFLSVMSSRPVEEMAPPEILRAEQIGLSRNILIQRVGPDFADVVPTDPFRSAFLRIQQSDGMYQQADRGVRFIAPGVFRAELRIPGAAPIGRYQVSVKVLRAGHVTAETGGSFDVQKSGFEQKLATFAQSSSLLYGLAVSLGSLIVGFIGNIIFRKE